MKSIKFRAMDDSQVAMFKALGANAVPMWVRHIQDFRPALFRTG